LADKADGIATQRRAPVGVRLVDDFGDAPMELVGSVFAVATDLIRPDTPPKLAFGLAFGKK
jgi:hypothetical protein